MPLLSHPPPCQQELSLSRCGIGDAGGRAIAEGLSLNHTLHLLDLSWNAMRGDTARALQVRASRVPACICSHPGRQAGRQAGGACVCDCV